MHYQNINKSSLLKPLHTKQSMLCALFIATFLFILMPYYGYCTNECAVSEISIDEYMFILDKIIRPDFISIKTNCSCFEKIEISCNKLSNEKTFTIAIDTTNMSTDPQHQPVSIKYILLKRNWRINNTSLRVFSVSGKPWERHSPQRVLAMGDDNSTYFLAGFQYSDFNKLVCRITSRSYVSKEVFNDICCFYLTNIYARGFYVKILNSLDDINFVEPQVTNDPFWNQMVKEYSDSRESKDAINKHIKDMIDLFKSEIAFHKPALIVDRKVYHKSLFTYFYGTGDTIEWNFKMGPDKEMTISKRLAMPRLK